MEELKAILVPDLLKALVIVLSDKHSPDRPAVADFLRQLATETEQPQRSPGRSTATA